MSPYTLPPTAVWLITGCSSGIGAALATHLLTTHPTHRIVATARNPSSLSSLPCSANLLTLALDVSSEPSIQAALAAVLQKWGRIDVLVNNAGYNILAAAELVSSAHARALMETNFWGAVRLSTLVLPIMRVTNAQREGEGGRGGVILQISSLGGCLAFAGNSFYHASKFALEGWTEAVSKEMEDEWNIHFCIMEPGGVKTRYAATSLETAKTATAPSTSTINSKELELESASEAEQAYASPKSALAFLRAMHEDPAAIASWADPNKVVEVMYDVVASGGEIPLRVPLGADSWGIQMRGNEKARERLVAAREVAVRTTEAESVERVLEGVRFLEV